MTREELLAGVKQLEPWFHCIDLGQGVKTRTASLGDEPLDHPAPTWAFIRKCLPADLTGKSVLDVGCNAGFYAVEAKRRNAARVVGVDSQRAQIRQALFVRRALGLDLEFRRLSVYDLSPQTVGRFDITLALGLLYHCKHLVLALEKLYQVTKEILIVESAVLPSRKAPRSFALPLGGLKRNLHALAYVENAAHAKEAIFNWFLPSPACLQALLQDVGFHDVTLHGGQENRAVLVCRKKTAHADSQVLSQLGATLTLVAGKTQCLPGEELHFRVQAENTGFARWLARGNGAAGNGEVRLGAHLLKADEEEVAWNYGRVPLSRDMDPGANEVLDIYLRAPAAPGEYWVEFDMVSEHLAWFEDLGSPTLRQALCVGLPDALAPTLPPPSRGTHEFASRDEAAWDTLR